MNELTISVSQLNGYIKNIFDAEEMLIGIKVVGEITNLKPSGKAIYFDLKDDGASIPCVVFDSYIMEDFEFGDKVVVKGKLNYYIKGGKLSFVVSKIEKYGIGELYKQFLELKSKLEKEGLFDEVHKKQLPEYAKRVGVVTSSTGAVIRDIIRVKKQKNHYSDIVLFPAKVQGIGAKEEIIKGIEFLDSYGVDTIIVARGGGSFEDYQPFNTEEVARAVFNAKTPIISAIGHENDWSIIDYVADARASTPSVASEMAFFDEKLFLDKLIQPLDNYLLTLKTSLKNSHEEICGKMENIANSYNQRLKGKYDLLTSKSMNLQLQINHFLKQKQSRIELLALDLSKNNPIEVLARGYGKVIFDGKSVSSVEEVKTGQKIDVILKNGIINAQILDVKERIYESR